MYILYDSKQLQFKDPFGTLTPGQDCTLHIHIPSSVQTTKVECIFTAEDGTPALTVPMSFRKKQGAYDIYFGKFAFVSTGLYFYYFHITTKTGAFRLFKVGDTTNMEAGDCWQVSCVPQDFGAPDWALGGTMYQIFPDRFAKSGKVSLADKLEPFSVHEKWDEEVDWRPTREGKILNNDFFGGNFRGISEKMDYIASLGTTILYLNPIGKAFSNHRYDTGDYKIPDPMLGTTEDFSAMCQAAHAHGIRVVLDGVFSHTGSNSLYFNKDGNFGPGGAYHSKQSPFYSWYMFQKWPNEYTSWWNFDTLPTVDKTSEAFQDFIFAGPNSVVAHWLQLGADGFRLDVADELPNEFLLRLKTSLRKLKPDALLIGEVWEDASNKLAYNRRKRYFVDGVLDSVMNYPFRTAILNFLKDRDDGKNFRETVMTIAENYPRSVLLSNMNLLGTHDTPRILTALVDDFEGSREEQAKRHLSRTQYPTAVERLMMASFLQYTLPGVPSLYYADEAGMEGHKDPFNRRTYPWGHEDAELIAHFSRLGQLRQDQEILRLGDIRFFEAGNQHLGFTRNLNGRQLRIYANRSSDVWNISVGNVLLGHNLHTTAANCLSLAPMGWCIVEEM